MPTAWDRNGAGRIGEIVRGKGFSSLLDLSESRPTATFLELADELGEEDVAAVQLQWLLKEEALATRRFQRFARASLVRRIYEKLPQVSEVGTTAAGLARTPTPRLPQGVQAILRGARVLGTLRH